MERKEKQLRKCPKSLFCEESMQILQNNTPEGNCF